MAKNYTATAGGMLDDLKARLGFGGHDNDDYEDDYDDYDDGFEDDYDDYDDGYDDRRSSSRRSSSSRSYDRDYDRGYDRRGDSGPRLVSIDDVKESTRVPESLNRDPLARGTRDNVTHYSTRSVIDETVPPISSPAHNAALRDSGRSSSDGYNSLFEPTRTADTSSSSYDPYEAYSTGATTTHAPMRSLTVLKPTVYGDVERVSKAVKAGDVVVLVMRNTPDDLSKRILDFSFGVASALDANVECPGEKVFAIARGNALSEDEKRRLRNQGAL